MDKKRKINYAICLSITLFLIMVLVSGSTYAYWVWNSESNTDVVFYTSKEIQEYIEYTAGDSHFIGDFQPTGSFCESAHTTHAFQKTMEALYIELRATIKMNVNFIGENTAASDSVYWVLTTGGNNITCEQGLKTPYVVSYGKFTGVSSGDVITLKENIPITPSDQMYTVWIWIDGNSTNLSALSGETLDVNVWTQIDMLDSSKFNISYQEPILNGAGPQLSNGMIPITISTDGTATTVDPTSSEWYSYENKMWANAVLVSNESRDNYYEADKITIKPNQIIPEANILAYYVWIPKYSYKINGFEETISVAFNNTPDGYIEHPAFEFDGPIPGFWVGKFETSHATLTPGTANLLSCANNEQCTKADGLRIKPNVTARGGDHLSNQFYATRSLERSGNPFGLVSEIVDSHPIKNTEWGAIAYLSQTIYGINKEVRMNNHSSYKTGCGALQETSTGSTQCQNAYGSVSSGEYPQSTTGNITGIFDMAGGSNEYVMGYFSGANSNYKKEPNKYFGYTSSANQALFTTKLESKYWDDYPVANYATACNGGICYGHALDEIAGWYSDYALNLTAANPWLTRGGYSTMGQEGGGIFLYAYYGGKAMGSYSFRMILVNTY